MAKVRINPEDWQEAGDEFAKFLCSVCSPPSDEPTEVFAEKNVVVQDGPFAGSMWRLQFTPFAKFIFAGCRTAGVKRVTIMMSAQYVKTMALLIDFLRNAAEDPADTMWVMADADQMAEFMEKRLMPYIEGCVPVEKLFRGKARSLLRFETFNLLLRGSNSRAKLQSDPIRRVYCDERREWKPGAIDLLRKRMRTFPNALEISAGTAGKENDELHADYLEGSQTRAHIQCPKCGHSQPIRFSKDATTLWPKPRECGGFLWDTNDTTKPGGEWNYAEVAKTVRFECENPQCRATFKNAQKYDLIRTMHPHDYNPSAPPEFKSFGGSAFEAIWESCDWDKLVIEFLKAVEQAKLGNVEPLKAFITETLGEPWKDEIGVVEDYGFLEARKSDYGFGDVWPDEITRFMAADRQEAGGEHYWYVIRAFGPFGKSRLINYGRCNSKLELEETRQRWEVPIQNAVIDSGYNATDVYKFCLSTGWKAFKGDDAEFFMHRSTKTKKVIRRLWEMTRVDPFMGTANQSRRSMPLFRWSNNGIKDALTTYMNGLVGEWTIPKKSPRQYMKQVTAERREEVTDLHGRVKFIWKRKFRDNHLFDCELMIHCAAIITRIFQAGSKVDGGKR
jgi:phage terminase large subunit GpA-like protein